MYDETTTTIVSSPFHYLFYYPVGMVSISLVRNNKINIQDYEIIWILVSSEKTINTMLQYKL